MKKHNNKTDLLSECPQNIQYAVPQFTYRVGKSTLTTTNGLWSLFIDKFTTKIISSSQVSSSIIKNVQDNYGSLNNQLTREIVVNQGNFHIARTDSALNIIFINEANTNLIHDIREGCITTWHNNGVKKTEEYYANDLLDGTQREWTANDKLISEISYTNGILDGHYQLWFDNLQLREFKNYNQGLLIDKHSIWTENGQLLLQEEFNANGIATGPYLEYYPSGQKRTGGQYKKGKKTGCFISLAENGKKIKKEVYKKGILKHTINYH
jgi:antitoxin component YwqK of YwqJK toxin-antitoxin module